MADELAVHGGPPVIGTTFPRYNPIGIEEIEAAHKVLESGRLSQFVGAWEPDFFGGPEVQALEREWEAYFNTTHAVSVNSWTSGLIAAVGAIGIEPGDEIIVTPWTMCASATAVLHWNAIPIFVDIEEETFCLDPAKVEAAVSPRTRAIISVDIFGHPANVRPLMEIAHKHDLLVVSDTAQAPGVLDDGKFAGTLTHVGGYSLNHHKHIHTGEGGILVTNDSDIAMRAQLIRNHGEAVVQAMGYQGLQNILGFNFRLGEIEAAIGRQQLKKLPELVARRGELGGRLSQNLEGLSGLRVPVVREGVQHAYYVFPLVLDNEELPVAREKLLAALQAEGVQGLMKGYANIHRLPMYEKKIAYGSKGFPWTTEFARPNISYGEGLCPTAERLHEQTFIGLEMCLHELDEDSVDLIAEAFHKIWRNLHKLM